MKAALDIDVLSTEPKFLGRPEAVNAVPDEPPPPWRVLQADAPTRGSRFEGSIPSLPCTVAKRCLRTGD
ncbi:hypothetical protein [Nevskia sp.]|uniref:hypothetical protein n=1 Tax=Nevskia sp. TaxID=1929292 RepID=UPI0025DF4874|nr:hypothetical protein [Nevskia sp.]